MWPIAVHSLPISVLTPTGLVPGSHTAVEILLQPMDVEQQSISWRLCNQLPSSVVK
jgi:hypothetical protein